MGWQNLSTISNNINHFRWNRLLPSPFLPFPSFLFFIFLLDCSKDGVSAYIKRLVLRLRVCERESCILQNAFKLMHKHTWTYNVNLGEGGKKILCTNAHWKQNSKKPLLNLKTAKNKYIDLFIFNVKKEYSKYETCLLFSSIFAG